MHCRIPFVLPTAAVMAIALAACSSERWDAPRVRSVTPAPDAVDVPIDAEIRVEFDRRIRASSLNGGNFYVWDVDADVEVDGQRLYEPETRTAIFLSTDLFESGRRYRVVVDDDVVSERYGIRLRDGRIWEFTTVATASIVLDQQWQLVLLQLQFESQLRGLPADRDVRAGLALALSRALVLARSGVPDDERSNEIATRLLAGDR